jgi:microcystin-dependent protein
LISAYPALAAFLGTTWGGNGTTTFGIPWCKPDYADVQANANIATETVGAVISHLHTGSLFRVGGSYILNSSAGALHTQGNTDSTGGTANLAAGVRVLKCIKY